MQSRAPCGIINMLKSSDGGNMNIFKIKNISPYQTNRIPVGYYVVRLEPTQKYPDFILLLSKKEQVAFEDVVRIFLRSVDRSDYLGAMSLIYWKYYYEFYDFLEASLTNSILRKKYRKAVLKFNKRYLKRWIEFIKYSDDTMYPQNEVLQKINDLIAIAYFRRESSDV